MRRTRTPLGWLGVTLLSPCVGCLLQTSSHGDTSTTDVALDTGDATTEAPPAGSSSSGAPADDGSSSGAPPAGSSTDGGDDSTGAPDLCGNGLLDPGEECDGDVTADCAEYDPEYNGGELGCDGACRFDTTPCETCQAPAQVPCDADSDDPFAALELGCDAPLISQTLIAPDPTASRTLRRFGVHPDAWTPRAGARALLISTGSLGEPDPEGALVMGPGSAWEGGGNANQDYKKGGLADTMKIHLVDGGSDSFTDCPEGSVDDCSNTLADQWKQQAINDLYYMDFEVEVPAGTHGYALDLALFSSHYPKYDSASTNDMAIVWMQSEIYVGNISYVRVGDSVRALSLPAAVATGWTVFDGSIAAELGGTGYDDLDQLDDKTSGSATPWLTAVGPAKPGEHLGLAIAVFDLNDNYNDSALLLDNFRWRCEACELDVDCGLRLAE